MTLIAFDGTWNDEHPKSGRRPSNVRRFWEAYPEEDRIYQRGIGNDEDCSYVAQRLDGAWGWGGAGIMAKAAWELGAKLEQGTMGPVDVIGFSRGGALALDFANRIVTEGVPLPSTKRAKRILAPGVNGKGKRTQTIWIYERQPVPVRWLGLWDVVPAMGIPGNDINLGYRLTLPEGARVSHAMALDVADVNFRLWRVEGAREVWFMGAHSEVGGGWGNERLADGTLRWMMREARRWGVPIEATRLKLPPPGRWGVTEAKHEHRRSRRVVRPGDRVHRTVARAEYPHLPWKRVRIER